MINFDRQREAQEALRHLDEVMTASAASEEALQKHAQGFRDNFFAAFQFIERESLQHRTLFVETKRVEAGLLNINVRGRTPLALFLDKEPAYDHKVLRDGAPQGKPELAVRVYAFFAPPYQGVLRHYTIFGNGEWKRTVFVSHAGATNAIVAMQPVAGIDALLEEATNLLSQACAVNPTWNALTENPASLGLDQLRDRQVVKRDPLGLG